MQVSSFILNEELLKTFLKLSKQLFSYLLIAIKSKF